MEVPMVVVYRASWVSYLLGRLLVRIRHIALVNILAGGGIVPELLQGALTPAAVRDEIVRLWHDETVRSGVIGGLREVRASLGNERASENAARMVLEMMEGCRNGG
jgi:lipid-A-disaccharide synthase